MFAFRIRLELIPWNGTRLVQHVVCLDRSGCNSLQSRKFLCKLLQVQECRERCSIIQDLKFFPTSSGGSSLLNITLATLQGHTFSRGAYSNSTSTQRGATDWSARHLTTCCPYPISAPTHCITQPGRAQTQAGDYNLHQKATFSIISTDGL